LSSSRDCSFVHRAEIADVLDVRIRIRDIDHSVYIQCKLERLWG
jgi:hypothetical protein